ncbi:MAG: Crp/Fnr family transcriptional regulator [Bdellovibrio sp.]|nr:Crp/Fnr family transcriptional regulator [Bdellovibrio sp.]
MAAATPPPIKTYKVGETLFRENDPSRSLFIIKKGTISIRKVKGSAFVEIARACQNEILGELSFFDRLPRSATAVAITNVEAIEITFEALEKIYDTVPDYMKAIIASLSDRLRKANDTIKRLQKNIVPGAVDQKQEGEATPSTPEQQASEKNTPPKTDTTKKS